MLSLILAAALSAQAAGASSGGAYCPLSAQQAKRLPPPAQALESASRSDALARANRRFAKHDKNNDGRIVADEIPSRNRKKAMKKFDKNGDGVIDKAEWTREMLGQFDKRDANHDGTLTPDERGARYSAAPIKPTTEDDGDEP